VDYRRILNCKQQLLTARGGRNNSPHQSATFQQTGRSWRNYGEIIGNAGKDSGEKFLERLLVSDFSNASEGIQKKV
jgi:hypothetical protein